MWGDKKRRILKLVTNIRYRFSKTVANHRNKQNMLRFALRKLRIRLWVIQVGFVVKNVALERDLLRIF